MTSPTQQNPGSRTAEHQEFSLERISRLITELEQELANAPEDIPNVRDLREEIETLKNALASPQRKEGSIRERLHAIRGSLQNMTAEVEGEVLKDSPYIVEIGRILGMV